MTPAAIISDARADGILVGLAPDGGLAYRGPRAAADKWLPILRSAKAGIVAHLSRARSDTWDAADWRVYFNERAGVLEFNGGTLRPEAERLAWQGCIVEWLNRHPVRADFGRCYACGHNGTGEGLVPYGLGEATAWLHGSCWPAWYASRRAEAENALTAMGAGLAGEGATNGWRWTTSRDKRQ